MKKHMYWIVAIIVILIISVVIINYPHHTNHPSKHLLHKTSKILHNAHTYAKSQNSPFDKLKRIAPTLHNSVINKILTILECANEYNVNHNNIITIIDYSLPSNQKRLWIVDLNNNKLLFHTYVSHGIKSGFLLTNNFSNKHNSKASSIGVYRTEKAYYGREGLSLRLEGLERSFNDQAYNRSIVMHGGWYMDEDFIKKYGRSGRSWGCTALPLTLSSSIINTIKDQSFFVVYYPNEQWLLKSRFLNCKRALANNDQINPITLTDPEHEPRDDVLFVDFHRRNAEDKPIIIISADDYKRIFQTHPPLTRMLRRQINHLEYIALSNPEFKKMASINELDKIYFAVPELKMHRGYYETEMKFVGLGKIQKINWSNNANNYTIYLDNTTMHVNSTNRFIRWLGL